MKTFRLLTALLGSAALGVGLGAQPAPSHIDVSVMAAQAGENVILPVLKGVRIVANPTLLDRAFAPGGNIEILGVPSLQNEDTTNLLGLFLDKPVSRESMERLRVALRLLLAQHGRAFSLVYTPPQDITDGRVQLVVQESVVGEVSVEGDRYFAADHYIKRLAQTPGQAVDGRALAAGVDRINRNAFRRAATRVEAGARPGTTDIVIQVSERLPWRVFGGYSNTGTRTTTEDRLNAGINWGNAFGLGHQMSLQWTSDLDAQHSRSLSTNYTADLPRGQSVTLFGAYSEIESVPSGGLSQEGMSWQAGLNYDVPLGDLGRRYTQGLQFGADFKVSDNNLEFALPPFVIPISNNLTHIAQLRAQYRGTLSDGWGATSWGGGLTASPGGLTGENDDTAFGGSRAGAKARYAYAHVDLRRETRLGFLLPNLSWMVRGEVQFASGNLLGSEQFSAGGTGSVRGYEQGEVVGDNAMFLSQELRFGSVRPLRYLGIALNDGLTPYLFHDYARVWNVDKLSGERPFNLHSVGAGLTYQFTRHASLRADYGWQLRDSGSSDTGKHSRLHLAANVSF